MQSVSSRNNGFHSIMLVPASATASLTYFNVGIEVYVYLSHAAFTSFTYSLSCDIYVYVDRWRILIERFSIAEG